MSLISENQAAFGAYNKLTVVANFKKYHGTKGGMAPVSFGDFLKAQENNKVVNKEYARSIPQQEIIDSNVNKRFNDVQFENKKLSYIEKAYQLGMVGYDGILIPFVMDKKV